jgi:hypothetical protein
VSTFAAPFSCGYGDPKALSGGATNNYMNVGTGTSAYDIYSSAVPECGSSWNPGKVDADCDAAYHLSTPIRRLRHNCLTGTRNTLPAPPADGSI